ncbi:MAG: N-acetyltransferase [Synergistaceae bacterium]|nr:N-acetyltransferase [Synergistaceae bacterium]
MTSSIIIRNETEDDYRNTECLVREAFWNVYRPGCTEHYILHRMRDNPAFIRELDLVMLIDGEIIGQNVFVRASITSDDGRIIPVSAMGPICIKPELQRKGYGKILLDYSLDMAANFGVGAVCFEGNIDFYGKSGFTQASNFGIRYHGLPEGADASFFLCRELNTGYLDGITGEYSPPDAYFMADNDPEGFSRFEATFPPKEKLTLPGQLWQS